jgi:hypothetical protein
MRMANKCICIDEIKGCEGNCITMNDYRVAGPKPWGGGIVVKNWVASVDDVIRALRDNDVVKVVRCKDCKKWEYDENFSGWCTEWRRRTLGNHFCSYGERKDNEVV